MFSSTFSYILYLIYKERQVSVCIARSDTQRLQTGHHWMIHLERRNASVQLVLLDNELARHGKFVSCYLQVSLSEIVVSCKVILFVCRRLETCAFAFGWGHYREQLMKNSGSFVYPPCYQG